MNGLFAGWGARLRQSVVGLMALLLLLAFAQSSRADFSISDAQEIEGNPGDTKFLRFTVTRTGNPAEEGFVFCQTRNGAAQAEGDYFSKNEPLIFDPGNSEQFFDVTINGDTNVEDDEAFSVFLINDNREPITDLQGVGTILNDDVEPPFIVNSAGDTAPNGCDVANCTLREAIIAANALNNTSTVEFAPALAGEPVLLTFTADSTLGPTALTISTPVIINGLEATTPEGGITIRNNGVANLRLFRVTSTGNLTLRSLTLSGGTSIGGDGSDGGGGGAGLGGAILVGDGVSAGGTLTVERCTLAGNNATGGTSIDGGGGGGSGGGVGGSGNNGGFGGGGNGGFGGGGGGSVFDNGGSGGFGGGGSASFLGKDGNGGFGGGSSGGSGSGGGGGGLGSAILNYGGNVTLSNSTIANNIARGGAGGTGAAAGSGYGAVFNGYGTLTVNNSTFSGNTADSGGAIFNNGDGAGHLAELILNNSILANSKNAAAAPVSDFAEELSGGSEITSGSFNIIQRNNGFGGDSSDADPALVPLTGNGGPTETFAITVDSPAYNAGDPKVEGDGQTDQRGGKFARVSDRRLDIGAYELQVRRAPPKGSPLMVNSTGDVSADDGETTLREAIEFANSDPDMSTVEFDPEVFATAQIITLTQGDLRFLTDITIKSPAAGVTIKGSNGRTILQLRNQVFVFRVRSSAATTAR
jgi:CSLREA domain-containing protein